jgi:hypothetical protein
MALIFSPNNGASRSLHPNDLEEERYFGIQEACRLSHEIDAVRSKLVEVKAVEWVHMSQEMDEKEAVIQLEQHLAQLAKDLCFETHRALGPIASDGALSIAICATLSNIRIVLDEPSAVATITILLAQQQDGEGYQRRAA